jgi:hypothetical protein
MKKKNNRRNIEEKDEENKKGFNTSLCEKGMTFEECELAILRNAVDESEAMRDNQVKNTEDIQKLLNIVEDFIIERKLLLYGGTAINNILPKYAQFYNRDIEIPDYDFYSPDALKDAKDLANIFYKQGYVEVEAKAGMHMGTFKVFVNFIPIADITQMHEIIYGELLKDAIIISRMYYTPPNYLRMSMYLELSRPSGDVSRWEKVLKRLNLLNEYYPFKPKNNCVSLDFHSDKPNNSNKMIDLYIETRENLINQGVIFFGGYAASLYSKYMPSNVKTVLRKYPDFDVLSDEPDKCALILKEHLTRANFKKITVIPHEEIGEIIPYHNEVRVDGKTIAFIFKPIACHSYNKLYIKQKEINVATIDTILAFYLSFLYVNLKYYDKDRIICMAKFLFDLEQHNRLSQKGLLKRFTISCYGNQPSIEDIRAEKAEKYKELIKNRNSKEYEMWFLKYSPHKNKNVGNKRNEIVMSKNDGKNDYNNDSSFEVTDKELEWSEKVFKKKEQEKLKKEKNPKSVKKRERSFIEKYIGTPKTKKNRKSDFLF